MKRLTKYELAKQLVRADRRDRLSQKEAIDIIETLADLIICHFVEGGEAVGVRGFGTLKVVRRKSYVGSNPRTGHVMRIPALRSLVFKPSAEVNKRIN